MKYVCCRIRIDMLISCNFILRVSLAFLSEVILFSKALIKCESEISVKKKNPYFTPGQCSALF